MPDPLTASRRQALGLIGTAGVLGFSAAFPAPADAAPDQGEALRALIEASDAESQRLDPTPGDGRARLPGEPVFINPLADTTVDRIKRFKRAERRALARIDRRRLSAVDQIAYDVFAYTIEQTLRPFDSGVHAITRLAPLNGTVGLHVQMPDFVSGAGAPFKTVGDYEDGVARMEGFADYLDTMTARLTEGLAKGVVQSKVTANQVLGQVSAMLSLPLEQNPFYASIRNLPADMAQADKERFTRTYANVIEKRVLTAYGRLRRFLADRYLAAATDTPGRVAMKEGLRVYTEDLAYHTTLRVTPEDIHQMGRAEVARILAEMERTRADIGFKGDLKAFFEHVRTAPEFYYTRPEDLIARFEEIEARIWAGMPKLFARKPKAPFEVRGLPAIGSQRGTGYYRPGPPDGVTPGVLWFNMAMLPTRPIPTLETLTLHEGIPGHHYQITLAREDASLPPILRFGGLTAYSEGWALYAESLGRDLGLFTDPYQYFGHLDMEMLRAVRLVVDTGLHAQGWSRAQAIQYMLDNTSMAPRDVAVEIDRYIGWPGQACAYKPGELKIQELRQRAQTAMGGRFDVKAFHGQVIDTGAMPLAVLEAKVLRWMQAA
jgi:uncharacterized protein (DUF885 family)